MDDPELWRWIWLGGAAFFGVAEIASAGSFFMLPFAVGAAIAAVLAFVGAPLVAQWAVFLVISVALVAALRPLAQRLAVSHPAEGIGARRLIGQEGTVLDAIPAGTTDLGLVRVHREEWRAESVDGAEVVAGTPIRVVDQRGTRVVVAPVGPPPDPALPPSPTPETE